MTLDDIRICVVGLGYVGLPLARLFSTKYPTIGFDINTERVESLMQGHDNTLEVEDELLRDAIHNHGFRCTSSLDDIKDCNVYIVAVPTPVDDNNRPDLSPDYHLGTVLDRKRPDSPAGGCAKNQRGIQREMEVGHSSLFVCWFIRSSPASNLRNFTS